MVNGMIIMIIWWYLDKTIGKNEKPFFPNTLSDINLKELRHRWRILKKNWPIFSSSPIAFRLNLLHP